ncbi:MAG: signal peptidase II [Rubricella sp.]
MSPILKTWLVAIAAFATDQATKYGVLFGLDLLTLRIVDVFPPYLTFILGRNTGINFGLFADGGDWGRFILITFAVGVSALLTWWARGQRGWLMPFAFGMVIGGALGNAIDRVLYGWVWDFLNMSCCGIRNPYTFNVADIFIFAGAALIVLFSGRDGNAKRA